MTNFELAQTLAKQGVTAGRRSRAARPRPRLRRQAARPARGRRAAGLGDARRHLRRRVRAAARRPRSCRRTATASTRRRPSSTASRARRPSRSASSTRSARHARSRPPRSARPGPTPTSDRPEAGLDRRHPRAPGTGSRPRRTTWAATRPPTGPSSSTPRSARCASRRRPSPSPTAGGSLTVGFTLAAPASWTVAIQSKAGAALRTYTGRSAQPGPVSVRWDGRSKAGARAYSGAYIAQGDGDERPRRHRRSRRRSPSSAGSLGAPLPLASVTSHLESLIGDYGLYAVFLLMFIDAVFPAASELVMLYAGALAAGAFSGPARRALRARSSRAGGRRTSPSRWRDDRLHARSGHGLGDRRLRRPAAGRAPRPLAAPRRREARPRRGAGSAAGATAAALLGRVTPVVRSFVAIPAGIFRMPLGRYTVLTLIGSAIWCFGLAGDRLGASGTSWETLPQRLPLRRLRGRGARRVRDRLRRVPRRSRRGTRRRRPASAPLDSDRRAGAAG